MATETKMGLGIILILVVAFSFVVWKKIEHQKTQMAENGTIQTNEDSEKVPDAPDPEAKEPTVAESSPQTDSAEQAENGLLNNDQVAINENQEEEEPLFNLSSDEEEPVTEVVENTATEEPEINFEDATEEPQQTEIAAKENEILFDDSEEKEFTEVAQNDNEDYFENSSQLENESEETLEVENIDKEEPEQITTFNDEFVQSEEEQDSNLLDEPAMEEENLEISLDDSPEEVESTESEFAFNESDVKEIPVTNKVEPADPFEESPAEPVAQNENVDEFDNKTELKQVQKNEQPLEPVSQNVFAEVEESKDEEQFAQDLDTDKTELFIHVVRNNDNFWSISKKNYGTSRYFRALAAHNKKRIPDPKKMRSGMKVIVPSPVILEQNYPHLITGKSKSRHHISHADGIATKTPKKPTGFNYTPSGVPYYRIGGKNTLTGIARNHLGRSSRWIQIYELNRDRLKNPHDLKIGMELRLPGDASQVRLVDAEANAR